MVDILHRVGITSTPEAVYEALATREGLAGWWTNDTRGESVVGGKIQFRFRDGEHLIEMEVIDLDSAKRIVWKVTDGPAEWIGTRVIWELNHEGDYTIILFRHEGWKEPVEFMHHCSTKWAIFMMSLKELVETGTGAPDPRDVKIDNWN
jgi:uncharacterized protein YndB with AHSA1/START domain